MPGGRARIGEMRMPRWTEEDTLAMYEEGPIMPRWGDRMDQLEWLVEQEEARSGHQLMLDYYQRQIAASIQIQNLRVQQSPTPWVDQLAQKQREEAPAFLEEMRSRQQAAVSALDSVIARQAAPPAPVHHRGSQGMTRGYWLGGTIGKHPGYVSTRPAPSPTLRRAPTA